MLRMARNRRNKFYAFDRKKTGASVDLVFLVYSRDDVTGEVSAGQPFSEEDGAKEAMIDLLSRGVCSWIICYNGG